jgi:uncharacterized membrane protein
MGTLDAAPSNMRSKASIWGHPIHPALVAFPIGMYVGTVGALLGYLATRDVFYYRAAMIANLAGVVAALAAAVPGLVDLLALPRGSAARATAVKHGSLAVLATGLFAVSAAVLWRNWHAELALLSVTVPLAIAVAGLLVLVIVGMLGWSLVQTHHVGVKPTFIRPAHHNA